MFSKGSLWGGALSTLGVFMVLRIMDDADAYAFLPAALVLLVLAISLK